MYTDSHAHLSDPRVIPLLPEVIERAKKNKVSHIIDICTDEESLKAGLALHKEVPWVALAAATTPHDVEKEGEYFFPIVERHAKQGDLVAIGETGLDYFYEHSNRALQKEFLLRYFELAKQVDLPLIFHCRDAFADLFAFADAHYKHETAVLHCFTGTVEEARGVLSRGWFISFSGIITFKKSEALRAVVKEVPLDRMFIETDTPYLSPQSKRGQQNEPAFVVETAAMIAEIKNVPVTEVARATAHSAETFFSLSKQ